MKLLAMCLFLSMAGGGYFGYQQYYEVQSKLEAFEGYDTQNNSEIATLRASLNDAEKTIATLRQRSQVNATFLGTSPSNTASLPVTITTLSGKTYTPV